MSGLPKASKMTPDQLIEEARSGCVGLRKRQVMPAIEALAMRGSQEAIALLKVLVGSLRHMLKTVTPGIHPGVTATHQCDEVVFVC